LLFSNHDHTYANTTQEGSPRIDANPLLALEELAKQVAKSGVRVVRGEILIDDQLFPVAHATGTGPELVTPIMVNDNVLDIIVTPAKKPGELANVQFSPKTEFYQMDALVNTIESGQDNRFALQVVGPNQFTVRGEIAVNSKPMEKIFPVVEPTLFARTLFIEQLRKQGIRVTAPLLRPNRLDLPMRDEKLTQVAMFRSAPFSEVVRVTLKVSHNLYASEMPVLIATRHQKHSIEEGLFQEAKYLKQLDVPVNTISLGSGAGGGNVDSVTPVSAVKLFQGMSKRPEWDAFVNALPILGVDGTLASAVNSSSPAKGKVRGKTGTLVWSDPLNGRLLVRSKSLAGVMETAKGTQLYYAIYMNNVPLPEDAAASREGKVIGKLCEIIYENGP
jgi:D-alanyl-D-alanine carboxypeptidase/D-alanyl-D-alanine-endopeptidase (penicillin-binding protein 4)